MSNYPPTGATMTEGTIGRVGTPYPMVMGHELANPHSMWNGKTVSLLARIAQAQGGEVVAVTADGITVVLERNPGEKIVHDNILIRGTVSLQVTNNGANVEIRIRDEGSIPMTEEHADTELYGELCKLRMQYPNIFGASS
eukprot:TRINITY_DN4560_c0_g1_i2.p1 TRINITY_DN4560_c0_g1~~TRINITY_DN4560_c0_g1_i2.p1  ORF type:complete len:140 (+),score=22.93 TRINITY_DN4560_c0_g1_i2:69-488(+)